MIKKAITCAICGNGKKVILEDSTLYLYRCRTCGHVFKEMPEDKKERYKEGYFAEEHKNWFNNPDYPLFNSILGILKHCYGDRRIKILDAGCGNGNFLKYVKEKNPCFDLYGIDLIDNEAKDITFFKGDIMKDNIGMRFDVICNLTVIEHVDSPHAFAKKMYELLDPNGILITVTDNDGSMIYSFARMAKAIGIKGGYKRLYTTHHLHCFSNRSIRTLMELNDFDLIASRNHNHPIAAVDYPEASFLTTLCYKMATAMIFFISGIFNKGILQITVCRKRG